MGAQRQTELVTFRTTKRSLRGLRRIAKENGFSLSQLLRTAIDEGAFLFDQRQWGAAEKIEMRFRCGFCRKETPEGSFPGDWGWVNLPYEASDEHKVTKKRRVSNGHLSSICCAECRTNRELKPQPQYTFTGPPGWRFWVNGVEVESPNTTTTGLAS